MLDIKGLFTKKEKPIRNNYGLGINDDLYKIALEVCEGINGSGEYAKLSALFLVEIAMVETKGGKYWDKTTYAGMGLTQIDKIGFDDTIKRTSDKHKEQVLNYFGVDLDKCEWVELRHNPRLAFIITRLFLLLRKGRVPDTIEARANYWKRYYNTVAGKGTEEKYIQSNLKA